MPVEHSGISINESESKSAPAQVVTITIEKLPDDACCNIQSGERSGRHIENAPVQNVTITAGKLPAVSVCDAFQLDTRLDKPAENIYGYFKRVRLTDTGYNALVGEFGDEKVKEYIEKLDMHIASKGKGYASHLATIKKWINEDDQKNKKNPDVQPAVRTGKPVHANRFVNFNQRNWNYDAIEKLERQYVVNQLEKKGIEVTA